MNKKGFTLVELLGVVIILAIVLLIAIPNIMTLIERSKKDGYINDSRKMVYLVKYDIKKGIVNKPATGESVKVTLNDLSTSDLEKDKDGYTYDLNKSYVYITRENGNLIYYVQLVSDKGKNYRGILLVNVEDLDNEKRYEKYYENTDVIDKTPEEVNANKKYEVGIATSNVEANENSVGVRYGRSATVIITPKEGYYLKQVKCTNGYTTNAEIGVTAMNSQVVTISNNNHDYPSTCTFTGAKITYSAAIELIDTQSSKENLVLKYGGNGSIDITPKTGYFLNSASCTNGYTHNAEVGLDKTGKQTVTISNNKVKNLSVCTFESLPASPIMSGGSKIWTNTSRIFKVTQPVPSAKVTKYEYYVSNSEEKPAKNVSVTGSFTGKEVIISETGKYAYFRVIYANGIISNWSEAKDLYVDRDILAAPTVVGGGNEWKLERTFMITAPLPTSGISRYEYYISNSTEKPGRNVEVTNTVMSPIMTVGQEGQYIFFRAINNAEVISDWTDAINLYVDPNTYTITYNLNGGIQEDGAITSYNVETEEFDLPIPTRKGYSFKGWYQDSSLTGTSISKIPTGTRGNKNLYAKWEIATYTITYELNGGTQGANAITSYTVNTETFNLPTPTKTGYKFKGWSNATGEGKVSQIEKGTTGDKYFFAVWEANTYVVKFNANGGSGTMANEAFSYGERKALTTNTFTRTGYTFIGWATSASGGVTYTNKQIISNLTATDNATVNLYAVWKANTYTVTLNQQSGTNGSGSVTATYNKAIPNITVPTRTGYTFGGYYTSTNGGGTQYIKADGTSARNWDKAEAATLYAKWTAKTYTVTFDKQSGTGGTNSVAATYDSNMPSATAPTRANYIFEGYYTSTNGGGTQYYNASMGSVRKWNIASNTTLYAKWKKVGYTLTVTSKNTTYGTVTGGGTYSQGESVTVKATAKSGYKFAGWMNGTSTVSSNETYTFTMPGNNYSLQAMFIYDISSIKNVKVLNIYPDAGNNLKSWMDSYGKGKITVDQVSISDFNNSPGDYLHQYNYYDNGSMAVDYDYDIVVFGFWDCNAHRDLSTSAQKWIKEYLDFGYGVIFGHDTLTRYEGNSCGDHSNFNTLASYVNVSLYDGEGWSGSGTVTIKKTGVFTTYPYAIGNVGTTLSIPATHVFGQTANGDIWATLHGSNDKNDFYLTTYKNRAMIQTGHSNGEATADEQKMIANLIFYIYSYNYLNR